MSHGIGHNAVPRPWMDRALTPDARARLLEAALTEDERHGLLRSCWACGFAGIPVPEGAVPGAGFVAPIARLGVPGLFETDASLGVTNPMDCRPGDTATALPSGLAQAASWNPRLVFEAGQAIGNEAAKKGFNVLLAGGVNLARDPRNGRNFEYLGEDPLLAGVLAGEAIRGIQSQGVIATAKHFVLNDQETGRHVVNAVIDEGALRESDLLAFQIAIERGHPGSIMSAYNKVNGRYAAENARLLTEVLKGDWDYPGWVMADWGATPSVEAAAAGLDQQSGEQLDYKAWFDAPLREAVAGGRVPAERVSEMARRVLRSMFAIGLFDAPSPKGQPIDYAAHLAVARRAAEQGIVLLRNDGPDDALVLPIGAGVRSILVVGGNADVGVLSGGGSSQVKTGKRHAAFLHVGGEGAMMAMASEAYHPSSPLRAIRARADGADVRFCNGRYPAEAAQLARQVDLVIVFATQWMTEGADAPDLSLPSGQDALIAAVAEANPNTVVVLETGGPVLMPWLDRVRAVVELWYPGSGGGEALAAVLFGDVNPSGRLPITFPRSLDQLPRPQMPGAGRRWQSPLGGKVDIAAAEGFDVPHEEGSDVGYRWFARRGAQALFPFGAGLSYTRFSYADLEVGGGETVRVSFDVTNVGAREGIETAQVYMTARNGASGLRLLGWACASLKPSETQRLTVEADPRLLADFDVAANTWSIPGGTVEIAVAASAEDLRLRAAVAVAARRLAP